MPFSRPAGSIDEVAVVHTQTFGLAIHHIGEGVFAAGDMFGQSDTGIIAGLDDDATHQINHRNLIADLDEHLGATHAPSLFTDQHQVIYANLPALNLLAAYIAGHHFGQAGRWQRLIRVVFHQHRARIGVNQKITGRGQFRCRRHYLGGGY